MEYLNRKIKELENEIETHAKQIMHSASMVANLTKQVSEMYKLKDIKTSI